MAMIFAKAYGGAEVEMILQFLSLSYVLLMSFGYIGSETRYGLLSPFCQNTKVWKIESNKTGKNVLVKCSLTEN